MVYCHDIPLFPSTCVTGCLCVAGDGEALGEREEWKDDSEDIVGGDTPTDHEPLKRIEPQVRVCVCVRVCACFICIFFGKSSLVPQPLERHGYEAMEREGDSFIHTCNSVDGLVSFAVLS